jgi:hypothetical protein
LSYPDFYQQVCTDVLSAETCEKSAELSNQNKALIRGYFVRTVIDASCPECAEKYDEKRLKIRSISSPNLSLPIASRLGGDQRYHRAKTRNCEHFTMTYGVNLHELQWRLRMRFRAVETIKANEPVDWLHVSNRLQNHCKGSLNYVEK